MIICFAPRGVTRQYKLSSLCIQESHLNIHSFLLRFPWKRVSICIYLVSFDDRETAESENKMNTFQDKTLALRESKGVSNRRPANLKYFFLKCAYLFRELPLTTSNINVSSTNIKYL